MEPRPDGLEIQNQQTPPVTAVVKKACYYPVHHVQQSEPRLFDRFFLEELDWASADLDHLLGLGGPRPLKSSRCNLHSAEWSKGSTARKYASSSSLASSLVSPKPIRRDHIPPSSSTQGAVAGVSNLMELPMSNDKKYRWESPRGIQTKIVESNCKNTRTTNSKSSTLVSPSTTSTSTSTSTCSMSGGMLTTFGSSGAGNNRPFLSKRWFLLASPDSKEFFQKRKQQSSNRRRIFSGIGAPPLYVPAPSTTTKSSEEGATESSTDNESSSNGEGKKQSSFAQESAADAEDFGTEDAWLANPAACGDTGARAPPPSPQLASSKSNNSLSSLSKVLSSPGSLSMKATVSRLRLRR